MKSTRQPGAWDLCMCHKVFGKGCEEVVDDRRNGRLLAIQPREQLQKYINWLLEPVDGC